MAQSTLGDFDGVFGSPNFNAGCVDVTQNGVQGGCFTGARGAHRQNQSIGFKDDLLHHIQVAWNQSHIIDGHCAGRGQNTHYHVLIPTGCRQRGHTQFKGRYTLAPELDFAVLGQPSFSNIQIRHDLDPGDDASDHGIGYFHVFLADAIQAKSNGCRLADGRRLYVNIGRVFAVCSYDGLVHQFDNLAGCFIGFIRFNFLFFLFKFHIRNQVKIVQNIIFCLRTGGLMILIEEKLDELLDVFPDGD